MSERRRVLYGLAIGIAIGAGGALFLMSEPLQILGGILVGAGFGTWVALGSKGK